MKTLIHFKLCPFSRSIRLALHELGVSFEEVEENPWEWREAFLELNPAGSLPVLRDDDDRIVIGFYAISEYLSDTIEDAVAAREAPLFPGDAETRAEIRRLVDWFHRKLFDDATQPMLAEKVYKRFRTGYGEAPDAAVMRGVRRNLDYSLSYIDHLTADRRWLAGALLSFADLSAAAHISIFDYLNEIDWSVHAGTKEWYARMKSRPSVRRILADRQPGVAPPPLHYTNPDF